MKFCHFVFSFCNLGGLRFGLASLFWNMLQGWECRSVKVTLAVWNLIKDCQTYLSAEVVNEDPERFLNFYFKVVASFKTCVQSYKSDGQKKAEEVQVGGGLLVSSSLIDLSERSVCTLPA